MSLFRFVQWIEEGRPVIGFGDGGSRDYTYVGDIARGTIDALKPVQFEITNLGSDKPLSIRETIELIKEALEKKATIDHRPRHAADVQATWGDIRKADRVLGWRPRSTFQEGLSQSVRWYRENRDWAKDVHTG